MSVEVSQTSKLDTLKKDYNKRTTEDLFMITKPADYQCGSIDEIINAVDYAEKYLDKAKGCDEDSIKELLDYIQDVEYELRGVVDYLEEVRMAVDSVRSWGQDWKNLAKEIIEDNPSIDIENYI